MKKILTTLFLCSIIASITNAQTSKLSFNAHRKDDLITKVIYLNDKQFTGNRSELLSYEAVKLPQPLDSSFAILYEDYTPGVICRIMDPLTIFIKGKDGLWGKVVTVHNILPEIKKTKKGIELTIPEKDGLLEEGNYLLEEMVLTSYPGQVTWFLTKL